MITIATLYSNELALYGENGNIKALIYALEKENIKYKLIQVEKEDKLDFSKYNFVYLGSGRAKYLEEIKKRLLPYKDEILEYIENDNILLATGNAISILDFLELYEVKLYEKRKHLLEKKELKLDLLIKIDATTSLCKGNIKGFQNTEYLIKTTKNIMFNINNGVGNNETMMEGFQYKNLYATSIIGPLLARNDNLNQYFIEIIKQKLKS